MIYYALFLIIGILLERRFDLTVIVEKGIIKRYRKLKLKQGDRK